MFATAFCCDICSRFTKSLRKHDKGSLGLAGRQVTWLGCSGYASQGISIVLDLRRHPVYGGYMLIWSQQIAICGWPA